MPNNHNHHKNKDGRDNYIEFNFDKPLRIFVGEIEGDIIKSISSERPDGFKEGDKVVVMHSEDWLWFTGQLIKKQKG